MPVIPKALPSQGTIGIVSPASPLTKQKIIDFDKGILKLQSLGYKVILGEHVYYSNYYLAGSDKERAYDLMNMFCNPDIDAIICSRGGYGCVRLIDYIDIEIIKKNPKIFAGYSDITFLLNLFFEFAELITFHSPMIMNLNPNKPDFNLECLIKTISDGIYPGIIQQPENCANTFIPGIAVSRLIGGNLSTIVSTIGSKYEINTQNKILFIEEVEEETYKIDKMLTILKNTNKLGCCTGFIIGDFVDCNYSYCKSCYDVIKEFIEPLGKPTIMNFRAGHGYYNTTLPIGALIKLDAGSCSITVLDPVIC